MVMSTRTPNPGAPQDYDPAEFPAFAVTVDVVILTMSDGRLAFCSSPRRSRRSKGCGRSQEASSGRRDARRGRERELAEETGVDAASF